MPGSAYRRLLERLEITRRRGVVLGLERVRAVLDRLGAPDRRFLSGQVAGTNGKGSTAAMAAAILSAAGFRTGLYTSPHLSRFTERIRLDGREVDPERLAALDERHRVTGQGLTYFETATVLALLAMAEEGMEMAVLETGLGGRLDAVSAVFPVATAITSVALDHTDILGSTLSEIAEEKAGIAKRGVPLFLGPVAADADQAIARVAKAVGAPLHRMGVSVGVGVNVGVGLADLGDGADRPSVPAPALDGPHQMSNAVVAVALAGAMAEAGGRRLSLAAVAQGLASVSWPGRLEWVAPDVLVDGAHNVEGARALVAALPERRPRALVISIARGKDAAGILGVLAPHFDLVLVTRSENERARPAETLAPLVASGPPVAMVSDPLTALDQARRFVGGAGCVVVAGSLFLVGDIRAALLGEPRDPLPGGDPLP